MCINAQTKRLRHSHSTSTLVKEECLEQLVLQSGNKALHHLEFVFRRQLNENDLILLSGHRGDAAIAHSKADSLQLQSISIVGQEAQRREIFFIDPSLPDLETLLSGVPAEALVVLLKPSEELIRPDA